MRIAVFTNQFPARVSTFFARDLHALHRQGIELEVFTLRPHRPELWDLVPERQRSALRDGVPIHRAAGIAALRQAGSPRRSLATWRLARPIMRSAVRFGPRAIAYTAYAILQAGQWARATARHPYDHILAYWGNFPATSAYIFQQLTNPGTPFSMMLHAGTDLYRNQVFLPEKMLQAKTIFVVCEFNREYIRMLVPDLYPVLAPKIHLHHLGLDLTEFGYGRDDRSTDTIVAVGSFERVKGFGDLIHAVSLLVSRGVSVRLELVGSGPEGRRLRRLARDLEVEDVVRFMGWLPADATRAVIRRAGLLVHPSRELGDAVPTVIKEAMALGTPVVGTRVAGIPELLDDGRCGTLVPPGQPDQLAAAVGALLKDAAARELYASRARARAEALLDLDKNSERLSALLRQD